MAITVVSEVDADGILELNCGDQKVVLYLGLLTLNGRPEERSILELPSPSCVHKGIRLLVLNNNNDLC